jgi:DNA-binding response OmpR family regulator
MIKPTILIIDDERRIVIQLSRILNQYNILKSTNGKSGYQLAKKYKPDLILLDLNLPDIHGFNLLIKFGKEFPDTKICIISASCEIHHKVEGFKLGSDDFIVKPFITEEVVARVTALLRRGKIIQDNFLMVGQLKLDQTNRILSTPQKSLRLTPTECAIMSYFMHQPGQVISRDQFIDHIWREKECYPNTVDVHIKNLRRKIIQIFGRKIVQTAYESGYYLREPED